MDREHRMDSFQSGVTWVERVSVEASLIINGSFANFPWCFRFGGAGDTDP